MMIPAEIPAPGPGMKRLLGRMAENALFWSVLVLLGIGAVTSFYYEEQIAASVSISGSYENAPRLQNTQDKQNFLSASSLSAGNSGKTAQRILRYRLREGQLTIYP